MKNKDMLLEQFILELEDQDIPYKIVRSLLYVKRFVVKYMWEKKIREVLTYPEDLLHKLDLYPYLLPFKGNTEDAKGGITLANYAIAWSGGIVEIYDDNKDKLASLAPEVHLCIVNSENILTDFGDLFNKIPQGKDFTIITGPSKTADIEKIVVKGAHGPRELYVIILNR